MDQPAEPYERAKARTPRRGVGDRVVRSHAQTRRTLIGAVAFLAASATARTVADDGVMFERRWLTVSARVGFGRAVRREPPAKGHHA